MLADFTVPSNDVGFATTADAPEPNNDLFALADGQPVLARVLTPPSSLLDAASIRYHEGAKEILRHDVPTSIGHLTGSIAAGTLFAVPMGDVVGTTSLLVANVSGIDVNVDVFRGTKGADGFGIYNNPQLSNHCIWRVDLRPSDGYANLVISATSAVIAQIAVTRSNGIDMTTIPALEGS